MKIRFIFWFVGFLVPCIIVAQQNAIGLLYGGGKIIKHTPKLYHNPPAYSHNFEINYTRQTNGIKEWERRYGYPKYSFSLFYNDYKDSILKGTIAFAPTLQFDILRYKKISMYWRMGYGVAFALKHWQRIPIQDTINNYVGSTVNMFALLQPGIEYKISNRLIAKAAIALSHTSNGGVRKPNLGINLLTHNIGVEYYFNKTETKTDLAELKPTQRKFIDARLGIAYSEAAIPDGPLYANYNITLTGGKIINRKHKMFVGVDMNYNKKVEFFILDSYIKVNNLFLASSNVAICAGNEFLLGRFGVPLQAGYYVYYPQAKYANLYQKIGLNYYLIQNKKRKVSNLYIGSLMKAHKFNADYVEFYLGCTF